MVRSSVNGLTGRDDQDRMEQGFTPRLGSKEIPAPYKWLQEWENSLPVGSKWKTIFGDVIDLRAGKKTTDSGFGGFNDFNDGMDIWDAGFQTAMDATMSMAAGGFDKWNWAPGKDDQPESNGSGITSLQSAYSGDQPITGNFDIYKVNTATAENPVYIYLAYDTANNFVAEEVKADGSNWKIKYEGVADNASVSDLNNQKASDWQSWQPTSSDTPVIFTGIRLGCSSYYIIK